MGITASQRARRTPRGWNAHHLLILPMALTMIFSAACGGVAEEAESATASQPGAVANQGQGSSEEDASRTSETPETKIPWELMASRIREHYEQDIKAVPGLKLRYFFDQPAVPRPYLLMIEDVSSPSADASAALFGPVLQALRSAFVREYEGKGILPTRTNENRVLPVVIFANRKSYLAYRANGHTWLPMDEDAGEFYVSQAPEGLDNLCRGALFVYQRPSDKQFIARLLHSATQQLMHDAMRKNDAGGTPWITEGMAEYWSGYAGNIHAGWKYGLLMMDRLKEYNAASSRFYAKKRDPRAGLALTPQWLLDYRAEEFHQDRRGLGAKIGWHRADQARILGGALVFFLYNYRDRAGHAPYRTAMEEMLRDELQGQLTADRAREHLGITKDTDRATFDTRFFLFVMRTLRSSRFPAYAPGITAASGTRSR